MTELNKIALKILSNGKGILAADESNGTMTKRLDAVNIPSSPENRLLFRETLFSSESMTDCIGGVILYDETINQSSSSGKKIPNLIIDRGALPGIKVDTGAKDFALHPNEKITEGLDGLRDRLIEYKELGAKFAKWRAVITIGDNIPSSACIDANAHALARYAGLCQEIGIVPMVEPEVLMDADNTIETCYEVTEKTLSTLFATLKNQDINIAHTILKTNMVISGKKCPTQANIDEVAEKTVDCLLKNVPSELAGIVFLSGGQSAELATAHLNTMNKNNKELPWPLSFSYGRALQEPCLKAWSGNSDNIEIAQKALLHREKCNGLACKGEYDKKMEEAA